MIKKKTVIVLGAGASNPYGLPLGDDLRQHIMSMNVDHLRALPTGDHAVRPIGLEAAFVKSFRRSQATSIDSFLTGHDQFKELGKHAIARVLLPYENDQSLLESDPEDHWYRYLVNLMIEDADDWNDLPKNQVSFITFNYDRSLERFLSQTFLHRYKGRSEEDALSMLAHFPIVHVYGSLGSINPRSSTYVPYASQPDDSIVVRAARDLKVIPEWRDESDEFNKAKELLAQADVLCMLGFAFDKTNLERLGGTEIGARGTISANPSLPANHRPFAATGFGLYEVERRQAARRMSHPSLAADCTNCIHDMKSLQLLRSTHILQS